MIFNMNAPTKQKWTVQTVPWPWLPLYWIYGYGLGLLLLVSLSCLRLLCRIKIDGKDHLDALPNYIGLLWHDRVIAYFTTRLFSGFKKQIWLNHPDAYMKPIHVFIWFLGVEKLILGSTGRGGRAAAEELASYLKAGYSTMINPDGPYGPKYTWRKGALHLSKQTGCPIVPIRVNVNPRWYWPSWDKKWMAFPFFSTIEVTYGMPVFVKSDSFEEEIIELSKQLQEV